MAKLSQRRTSQKQKVLQRSNPFVSETFVSFGLLAGAPALETDVIENLVVSIEGKTDCKQWNSDDWGGYERVLPLEMEHYIGKDRLPPLLGSKNAI
jgi:hypothetical protein